MIERRSPDRKTVRTFLIHSKVAIELFTSFMVQFEYEIEQQIWENIIINV